MVFGGLCGVDRDERVEDDMLDPVIVDQYDALIAERPGIRAHPDDWRDQDIDYEYLYEDGHIVTRVRDRRAVEQLLVDLLGLRRLDPDDPDDRDDIDRFLRDREVPDGRYFVENRPGGVVRLWYRSQIRQDDPRPLVPDVVALVEEELGPDVAWADYIYHAAGRGCSAKGPGEVPPATFDPWPPPVRPGVRGCDGAGVRVAVLDTGFLKDKTTKAHWWLQGVEGDEEHPVDPVSNELKYDSCHGTNVTGQLRAVAPKAEVFVAAALGPGAIGVETDVIATVERMLAAGPDLIVCSFITATKDDRPSPLLVELFDRIALHHKGVTVFAPAGNDNLTKAMWPAAFPSVVSVGALSTSWRERASFSNYGGGVDVFAPGEDLVNAFGTGDYTCKVFPHKNEPRSFAGMARWSGTSFAAPIVAGLIAARMSATGENSRQATDAMLRLARSQSVPGIGPVLYPDQAGVGL
jgi:subtilisin family serine protease